MKQTKSQYNLLSKINAKEAIIGVVGMGYVGLSLLEVFGKEGFEIVGYDCDVPKVEKLKQGESTMSFMELDDLWPLMKKGKFTPSAEPEILRGCDIIVISVPTTLDSHGEPDFGPMRSTFQLVADLLRPGQLIILQCTTYPGTTVEELLPALEETGLKLDEEYFLGYVPEISDIGNPNFTFTSVPRIVSGVTEQSRLLIEKLYETIGCQVVPVASTQVAEAAKIYQNTYRLINISWVNEMKMLFDKLNIDIWEVIDAAAVKPFGFTRYEPGPGVGGDCIPIDPFYLTWKAAEVDGPVSMIEAAGVINRLAPHYVVTRVMEGLNKDCKAINGSNILVLGIAFKQDVDDARHSSAATLLPLLEEKGAIVSYHDFFVPTFEGRKSITLNYNDLKIFDAIVIGTAHTQYEWDRIAEHGQLIIDTHNVMKEHAGNVFKG